MFRDTWSAAALLLIWGCHPQPPIANSPSIQSASMQPASVIKRGRFTIREQVKRCEISIDEVRYLPFGINPESCSLEPLEDPRAAALGLYGDHSGVYLLRLTVKGPVLDKLVEGSALATPRSWTPDGEQYVVKQLVIDTRTGQRRPLPNFPGDFWDFSPDGKKLLSRTQESRELFTLHLIDVRTGEDERTQVSAAEHPWLKEGAHRVAGTHEESHLWEVAHVKWIDDRGGYRFILRPSPAL